MLQCSRPLSKQLVEPVRCRHLGQGAGMRRREFLGLVGGAAAVWPVAARAQQSAMPVIGYLGLTSPEADAYLLGVFDHPQHENWAAEEIFAVMVRNWPDRGLVLKSNFVVGLSQEYSDEDRLELRKAGMNSALQIDGKVYSPGGSGMALDGTPLIEVQAAQQVMWELSRWEKDMARRLGEVDGVPRFAYWLPAVRTPVPGFEEYAGLASRSAFISIGRLR